MLAILVGVTAAAGVILLVATFLRPVPSLSDSLGRLSQRNDDVWDESLWASPVDGSATQGGGLDRRLSEAGSRLIQLTGLRPSQAQAAQLRLSGMSQAEWYGQRILCAIAFPIVLAVILALLTATDALPISVTLTAVSALIAAVVGWFYPALRMRGSSHGVTEDSHEALLVYIDLLILERMANKHAVDALANAAKASDHPLFQQIRAALQRAELERELPWDELERLAERISLPELNDITSVAKLQQEGGSLEGAFRARVSELRNAHTIRRLQSADATTQAMEIPRTLPVLVVTALFITPPLLQIAVG